MIALASLARLDRFLSLGSGEIALVATVPKVADPGWGPSVEDQAVLVSGLSNFACVGLGGKPVKESGVQLVAAIHSCCCGDLCNRAAMRRGEGMLPKR